MAVEITGDYRGGLNVDLVHGPSGTRLGTAAPVDNQGDGSSFSPTDLAAAALASCMLTIMGILARRDGIELEGTRFTLHKHMQSDPRRIGRIAIEIHMPAGLDDDARQKLEKGALTCPVYLSLHPEIEKPVQFIYPD